MSVTMNAVCVFLLSPFVASATEGSLWQTESMFIQRKMINRLTDVLYIRSSNSGGLSYRSTAGPVSYTRVARSRSESTSQFSA